MRLFPYRAVAGWLKDGPRRKSRTWVRDIVPGGASSGADESRSRTRTPSDGCVGSGLWFWPLNKELMRTRLNEDSRSRIEVVMTIANDLGMAAGGVDLVKEACDPLGGCSDQISSSPRVHGSVSSTRSRLC